MTPPVLITRERAQPLADLLRAHGLEPVHVPLLALQAVSSAPPRGTPELVLITSASTIRLCPELVGVIGQTPVIAVGPKTEAAARGAGLAVVAVGREGGPSAVALLEAQARALEAEGGSCGPIWHVGAVRCSPALDAALSASPRTVHRWAVYDNLWPPGAAQALGRTPPLSALPIASGSAAEAFARMATPAQLARAWAGDCKVVAIGAAAAASTEQAGLPVHAIASEPTLEGLAAATGACVKGLQRQ